MNRPFYAFGALLTALALAMLAVSSTSRSTSVSSAHPSAARDGHAVPLAERPPRTLRFSGILVVLPAVQEELSVASTGATKSDALFSTGCDWELSRSDLNQPVCSEGSDWDCRDACHLAALSNAPLTALVSAHPAVTLATHDPATLRDETSRDCRSHYDPAYDVLVYGEIDSPISSQGRSAVSDDELPLQSAYSAAVEWSDYAILMDEALIKRVTASASAESTNSVRSGGLMLDFAASALNRTGILLQSAAQEIRRASLPVMNSQLAGESPSNQR